MHKQLQQHDARDEVGIAVDSGCRVDCRLQLVVGVQQHGCALKVLCMAQNDLPQVLHLEKLNKAFTAALVGLGFDYFNYFDQSNFSL